MRSPYATIRRKVILEHLEKYPGVASMTIARIVYRDNPLLFKNAEDARNVIRVFRGRSGVQHRKEVKFQKYYEKLA